MTNIMLATVDTDSGQSVNLVNTDEQLQRNIKNICILLAAKKQRRRLQNDKKICVKIPTQNFSLILSITQGIRIGSVS